MKPEDYTKYFEAAQKYNEELAAHPSAFYNPDEIKDYEKILDITGTGIMGYITIKKLGVELPIYHGTDEGILQIAAGHLKGTSFPISGESTHSVISAHRGLPSAKLFTDLDKMEIGDTLSACEGALYWNRGTAAYSCYGGGIPDRLDDYGICYWDSSSYSSFDSCSYMHTKKRKRRQVFKV